MPDDYPAKITSGWAEAQYTREFYDLYEEILGKHELFRAANPLPTNIWAATPEYEAEMRQMVRDAWDEGNGHQRLRLIISHIGRRGNYKLPEKYLIFNMTPAHMCPSLSFTPDGRIDMEETTCQAFRLPPEELRGDFVIPNTDQGVFDCYAWRGENEARTPTVWQWRVRQNELWEYVLKHDPQLMVDAVETIYHNTLKENKKPVALRFSEGGDFPDQKSVNTFVKIAEGCVKTIPTSKKWGLPFITYTYTARRKLDFRRAARVQEAIILGSNFKKRGITSEFKYVIHENEPPAEKGTGRRYGMWPTKQWSICYANCRKCRRCLLGLNTKVVRHGG